MAVNVVKITKLSGLADKMTINQLRNAKMRISLLYVKLLIENCTSVGIV